LEAAGAAAPLEVSAAAGWTITSLLFDNVLVATAGPTFRSSYLSGKEAADANPVRDALLTVAQMMDHANADRASIGFGDAATRLCSGQAAMLFMPSFIESSFIDAGCASDIGGVPVEPSGTPSFVSVSIAFP